MQEYIHVVTKNTQINLQTLISDRFVLATALISEMPDKEYLGKVWVSDTETGC